MPTSNQSKQIVIGKLKKQSHVLSTSFFCSQVFKTTSNVLNSDVNILIDSAEPRKGKLFLVLNHRDTTVSAVMITDIVFFLFFNYLMIIQLVKMLEWLQNVVKLKYHQNAFDMNHKKVVCY